MCDMVRVFRTKWFTRFARREGISDARLCEAVRRAEHGFVDADLGRGVIKQRVARENEGKSGGFRSIILFRAGDRAFFVFGFRKSARSNLRPDELQGFRELADQMLCYSHDALVAAIAAGALIEVMCDGQND